MAGRKELSADEVEPCKRGVVAKNKIKHGIERKEIKNEECAETK